MLATQRRPVETGNGGPMQNNSTGSLPVVGATEMLSRTKSGGFPTAGGTLYVSKPFKTDKHKKPRAVISFVPRNSTFDPQDTRNPNEFRGFFTLFWISLFLLVVQNYIVSFEKHGYPIEMAFAAMFSRHALTLALSDAVLVLSTGFSVPFAIALKKGWITYYPVGVIIQHTFQTLVLLVAVTWTFNRKWPWVQSGFLTLHSLVMIMKMHSYMATNGYLQKVDRMFKAKMEALRSACSRVGGWDDAITEARHHAAEAQASESTTEYAGVSPSITPLPDGATKSYIDGDMAQALRSRLLSVPETVVNADHNQPVEGRKEDDYTVLVYHPDEEISGLAHQLTEMDAELTGPGTGKVRWPANIGLKSFADYMLIPTLVYELEYPRTERIRPFYVFEKTVATFGTFALLYTITENFILPLVPTIRNQSFFRALLDLALPFMVAYLLLFYIIFECVCNGFAELSRFADRQFYEDWWNSTSWDEFARKWNKPVHTFLLRHVYASTISSYKLSRKSAMFITFLLSACVHELVMAVVTKKIRMYLFTLQLIQIPLIALGRIPVIRRNKILGNVVFWIGLYAGFPLLCVAYCAY